MGQYVPLLKILLDQLILEVTPFQRFYLRLNDAMSQHLRIAQKLESYYSRIDHNYNRTRYIFITQTTENPVTVRVFTFTPQQITPVS